MQNRHRLFGVLTISCLAGLPALWGCLSDLKVYDPAPSQRAALHAVCCSELEQVMQSINKTYRRAQRLPIRRLQRRGFAILQESSAKIATHAGQLSANADLSKVSIDDRVVFERLADKLKVGAEALMAAAAAQDRVLARSRFAQLASTCNSCHSAFREHHSIEHDGGS